MIAEFVELVESLFPCVDTNTLDQAKAAIQQFYRDGSSEAFFERKNTDYLMQGDIVNNITFIMYDNDGMEHRAVKSGIILSHTCDLENKESMLIAPQISLSGFNKDMLSNIKNNLAYNIFYLPDYVYGKAFDFGLTNTYNTNNIVKMIDEKKISVDESLNQMGLYLFLCKITVYLLRKEDEDTNASRATI